MRIPFREFTACFPAVARCCLLAALVLSGASLSYDACAETGRVAKPAVVIENAGKCVEDTAFMRKNHMNLLKHQRGETTHKGIRVRQYSLANCIDCHASRKTNSVVGSDDNFCQSCHSYVAVKLDCFECHSAKPGAAFQSMLPGAVNMAVAR